jgi:tetratricopeptide (TPR) repeat protein
LEPTWKTGWVNLALLEEQNGHPEKALEFLEHALTLDTRDVTVWFNWGRIAENYGLASDMDIVDAYYSAIRYQGSFLPLSDFWQGTQLRQQAVERYLQQQPIDIQYRILEVHHPERLPDLVPQNPRIAAEWWVVGEYAFAKENDMDTAVDAFTQAIELSPGSGDYYVSRARTYARFDVVKARRDVITGLLLGSRFESPHAVLALLEQDEDVIRNLKINAVPMRSTRDIQEFAAVLYGRPAVFDILPSGYPPGVGGRVIQPWLDIANVYLEAGRLEAARNSYAFILSQAPYNEEARERLNQLPTKQ